MSSIDKRDTVKVVTSNKFISAQGLENLSLKARKLLYIAIAQCHKTDKEFFENEITCSDFAAMTGVKVQTVYSEVQKVADELLEIKLVAQNEKEGAFIKYNMFSSVSKSAGDGVIKFKLNPDMAPFLLGLKRDFSQPLLSDFVKMKSTYSMAIWHMMQREMGSKKPLIGHPMKYQLTVEEIRRETGTQDKFKKINDFKRFVLFSAIRDIETHCDVVISATDIKEGKRVVAFSFIARTIYDDILIHDDDDSIPQDNNSYIKVDKDEELEMFTGKDGQIELRLFKD